VLKQTEMLKHGSPDVAAVLAPALPGRHIWDDGQAGRGGPATYTIPQYPVHLIDVVRMDDGSRVIIRAQDVELQRDFFRNLSAESRNCRIITPLNELPENLALRFTSIDFRNHFALLAEMFVGGRQTMIGEARYIVDECDPTAGEFAIAIADVWQLHGIGRVLLDRLERQAAASGIERLVADTLVANTAMIGLAAQAGYVVRANLEDAMLAKLEKCLAPSAVPLLS
jgi:acetyltransferase